MNIAEWSIQKHVITWVLTVLMAVVGVASFLELSLLEDPEFTVKTAVVTTAYPGASPEEVEQEVTDRIELAIQELPEVDYLESYSRRGLSSTPYVRRGGRRRASRCCLRRWAFLRFAFRNHRSQFRRVWSCLFYLWSPSFLRRACWDLRFLLRLLCPSFRAFPCILRRFWGRWASRRLF